MSQASQAPESKQACLGQMQPSQVLSPLVTSAFDPPTFSEN